MTWINRTALGLLGLLDGKVSGFVPNDVTGTISPTLDLADHYAVETRRIVSGNSTITFAGQTAQLVVPDGAAWRLEALGVEAIGLAGWTWSGRLWLATDPNLIGTAGWIPLTPEVSLAGGGTEQRGYGFFLPRPMWLAPGTSLGFVTSAYTDGAANLFVRMRALVNQVTA